LENVKLASDSLKTGYFSLKTSGHIFIDVFWESLWTKPINI